MKCNEEREGGNEGERRSGKRKECEWACMCNLNTKLSTGRSQKAKLLHVHTIVTCVHVHVHGAERAVGPIQLHLNNVQLTNLLQVHYRAVLTLHTMHRKPTTTMWYINTVCIHVHVLIVPALSLACCWDRQRGL